MTSARHLSTETVAIEWFAEDSAGVPLVSKGAELEISLQRRSDDRFFDFDIGQLDFKAAGWTQQFQALTETEVGVSALYRFLWDLSTIVGAAPDDDYLVFARQNGGSDAKIPPPGEILVDQWVGIIPATRRIIENRLEVDFAAKELILYDDDGVTVLQRWALATNLGEDISTALGVQTKRGAPIL